MIRKIQRGMVWSDPARPNEFHSFMKNTITVCTEAETNGIQLLIQITSRKRIWPFGVGFGITKEHAKTIQAEKERQAQADEAKKTHKNFLKIWLKERDDQHVTGVVARKEERDRVRKVKELSKKGLIISPDLLITIPDPEAFWNVTDVTWLEEGRKARSETNEKETEEDEEDESTDATGYLNLQRDFPSF